jgi:5-methyltetrahydrofolate--homocysteine methyltransferase
MHVAAAAGMGQDEARGRAGEPPTALQGGQNVTRTVIESRTRTVVIGFDQPFCVIGERINPTGRKKLAAELEAGDFSTVEADAKAQVACGAMVLDVNSGAVFTNKMAEDPRYADNNFVEPTLMKELVACVQAIVDVPLCIDSSVPGALENGLQTAEGRPLLNSVTGEEERMDLVLPLVKKYNVPVVAISNDDTGISENPEVRFAVAKKIVERAADFGIPAHDIVVDPLVMPIGAMATAGQQVLALVRRLREELGVNTTCGASNVSFGLPHRHGINAAFLPMAIASGMTSAIMNPTRLVEMEAIRAANLLMNHDPNGAQWIRHARAAAHAAAGGEAQPEGAAGGAEGGGRRRRRG